MRFDKSARTIKMECWPRNVDVSDPNAKQHEGWPKTILQIDNYGREAVAWLPEITVVGATNPVVKISDEATGEVVYTLRMNGSTFRPKVFVDSLYTVELSAEGKSTLVAKGVPSNRNADSGMMPIDFGKKTTQVTSGTIQVDIQFNGKIVVNGKEMTIPYFEDLLSQSNAPKVNIRVNPNATMEHLTRIMKVLENHTTTVSVLTQPKQ